MGARVALLVALIVATVAAAIHLRQVGPGVLGVFGGCRFNDLTGLHCPGCGGTRALDALLHLRIREALGYNVMIFLFLGFFLVLGLVIAKELLGEYYRGPAVRFPTWAAWGLLGIAVVFGVLRNIPFWPFTLLAP